MLKISNIPASIKELFMVIERQEQLSGFLYGTDFFSTDEGFSHLFGIIEDIEPHIQVNTDSFIILINPEYSFKIKVSAFPIQNKILFEREYPCH